MHKELILAIALVVCIVGLFFYYVIDKKPNIPTKHEDKKYKVVIDTIDNHEYIIIMGDYRSGITSFHKYNCAFCSQK